MSPVEEWYNLRAGHWCRFHWNKTSHLQISVFWLFITCLPRSRLSFRIDADELATVIYCTNMTTTQLRSVDLAAVANSYTKLAFLFISRVAMPATIARDLNWKPIQSKRHDLDSALSSTNPSEQASKSRSCWKEPNELYPRMWVTTLFSGYVAYALRRLSWQMWSRTGAAVRATAGLRRLRQENIAAVPAHSDVGYECSEEQCVQIRSRQAVSHSHRNSSEQTQDRLSQKDHPICDDRVHFQEAQFGWMTVNALLNTLNHNNSIGMLDMGGGSCQIAYSPKQVLQRADSCRSLPIDDYSADWCFRLHPTIGISWRWKLWLVRPTTCTRTATWVWADQLRDSTFTDGASPVSSCMIDGLCRIWQYRALFNFEYRS